jgi:excisionase family DNA binding protein
MLRGVFFYGGNQAMLTVSDLMARFGVNETTVLGWIHSGELKAVNVGRRAGLKRPRWRVSAEAVAAFEAARTATPTPTARATRRRRSNHVVEFYK